MVTLPVGVETKVSRNADPFFYNSRLSRKDLTNIDIVQKHGLYTPWCDNTWAANRISQEKKMNGSTHDVSQSYSRA